MVDDSLIIVAISESDLLDNGSVLLLVMDYLETWSVVEDNLVDDSLVIVVIVSMESIAGESIPNSSCSSDAIGKFTFSKFMDPPNQLETINFTFHITDVVTQKNEQFKNILSLMRNGTLTNEKCKFLINRFLSKVN